MSAVWLPVICLPLVFLRFSCAACLVFCLVCVPLFESSTFGIASCAPILNPATMPPCAPAAPTFSCRFRPRLLVPTLFLRSSGATPARFTFRIPLQYARNIGAESWQEDRTLPLPGMWSRDRPRPPSPTTRVGIRHRQVGFRHVRVVGGGETDLHVAPHAQEVSNLVARLRHRLLGRRIPTREFGRRSRHVNLEHKSHTYKTTAALTLTHRHTIQPVVPHCLWSGCPVRQSQKASPDERALLQG